MLYTILQIALVVWLFKNLPKPENLPLNFDLTDIISRHYISTYYEKNSPNYNSIEGLKTVMESYGKILVINIKDE